MRMNPSVVANPEHVQTVQVRTGFFSSRLESAQAFNRASVADLADGFEIVGEREEERDSLDCILATRLSSSHSPAFAMLHLGDEYQLRLSFEFHVKRLLICDKQNFFENADEYFVSAVMTPGDKIIATTTCTPLKCFRRFLRAWHGIELKEVRTVEYYGGEPVMSLTRITPELARYIGRGNNHVRHMINKLRREESSSGAAELRR
jgi:hypothetical protein